MCVCVCDMCVCVCARARAWRMRACVRVCVRVCVYIADGWAGIACTVTANACVVTVVDN